MAPPNKKKGAMVEERYDSIEKVCMENPLYGLVACPFVAVFTVVNIPFNVCRICYNSCREERRENREFDEAYNQLKSQKNRVQKAVIKNQLAF